MGKWEVPYGPNLLGGRYANCNTSQLCAPVADGKRSMSSLSHEASC
jgi:hypothetical protein